MVKSMKAGSVIVDLAAEQGGNCELTQKDDVVVKEGVTIIGYTNLPSRLANQSSQLYATNLRHLLTELTPQKDGIIHVNFDDEVLRGATVIKEGKITWPPPPPTLSAAAAPKAETIIVVKKEPSSFIPAFIKPFIPLLIGGLALLGLGSVAPASFMSHFTVFVLACFIGYQVIWNVSPSLHTPLMSVTNAISGIIVIGALIQVSTPSISMSLLAGMAILIATINITGGFLVTRRMLDMFRK
jgi:NAD(P) transhydrogenase subunit alpha